MTHVDADVLALVALGEPADDDVRAHLDTCETCRAEVAELAHVVGVARGVTAADALVEPPPAVWDRIRAELGLGGGAARTDDGSAGTVDEVGVADGDAGTVPRTTAGAGRDDLAAARERRTRRTGGAGPWVAAAAVAGLAAGVVGTTWWTGREVPPTVVAETTLDPLPGWAAEGRAVVEVASDGTRELVVRIDNPDGVGGFQEVWLIDRDVTRLVSLGLLVGDEGRFVLPDELDLGEFPVVDVSDEPYDGDPAHSGDSIIRGTLDA